MQVKQINPYPMKKNNHTRLLTFLVAASCFLPLACYHNVYNHIDVVRDVIVHISIPPAAITLSDIELGTGTTNYNLDSFLKNDYFDLGQGYQISQLTKATVSSCVITIDNTTPANNIANFSSCTATIYTDINSAIQNATKDGIPDEPASGLTFTNLPGSDLKGYLLNNGSQATTYHYSIRGNLRRPLTDTLKCVITLVIDLHFDKAERLKVAWTPLK